MLLTTLLVVLPWFMVTLVVGGDWAVSVDPLELLVHSLGQVGLLGLIAIVALSRWRIPALLRRRRSFSLSVFTVLAAHVLLTLWWEQVPALLSWSDWFSKKPYLWLGVLASLPLVLMALTSTHHAQHLMGRQWKRLHRSIYVVIPVALLHWLWQLRSDFGSWSIFVASYLMLVFWPILKRRIERKRVA